MTTDSAENMALDMNCSSLLDTLLDIEIDYGKRESGKDLDLEERKMRMVVERTAGERNRCDLMSSDCEERKEE